MCAAATYISHRATPSNTRTAGTGDSTCAPHTAHLPHPEDTVRRADGVRLTSPPRTAVDMSRWLNDDDLRSLIDHVEYLGHATALTMRRVARSLDTSGRPWARRFLAVLDDRAGGGPRASNGESLVVHALRTRGVFDVTSQHRLDLPGFAHPVRLDAAVPRIRWGVEVDGHPDHFSELGGAYDRERDLAGDAIGCGCHASPSSHSNATRSGRSTASWRCTSDVAATSASSAAGLSVVTLIVAAAPAGVSRRGGRRGGGRRGGPGLPRSNRRAHRSAGRATCSHRRRASPRRDRTTPRR
jgi:hypothetical protein